MVKIHLVFAWLSVIICLYVFNDSCLSFLGVFTPLVRQIVDPDRSNAFRSLLPTQKVSQKIVAKRQIGEIIGIIQVIAERVKELATQCAEIIKAMLRSDVSANYLCNVYMHKYLELDIWICTFMNCLFLIRNFYLQ